MTFAWYGHLKFKELKWFENAGIITIILISWGLALFEYFFQVPANKIGYKDNGGPFSLLQLKVIQEVITLIVFVLFSFFTSTVNYITLFSIQLHNRIERKS